MAKHKYQLTTKAQDVILVECFDKHNGGIGPDYLAYTEQFENLFNAFTSKSKATLNRHNVWCNLIRLRKKGSIVLL